jgi:quercetin dioxygenase-like cupin family protein
MGFFNLSKMDFKSKKKGMFGKIITGENMQMAFIKLEHGVETNHSHENEQMGYILSGEVEITINNNKKICKAGEAYLIPANTKHGFKVFSENPVEYIEIFSPPKEELKEWWIKNEL